MDLALFDYPLPPGRIAQEPVEPRDRARLLLLPRGPGRLRDLTVRDLPELLRPGDCLVVNDTRVLPARLFGRLHGSDREVELLFLRELAPGRWEALARPGRRCRRGTALLLADGQVRATVTAEGEAGRRELAVGWPGPAQDLLLRWGLPPLPPYIRRYRKPEGEDWARYQTVYAARDGAVAAPTAGLHFTPALLERLDRQGVELHRITLHVGPGSFRPIRTRGAEAHRLEAEALEVTEATARALTRARGEGRRVIAVGTTTARALESAAAEAGVAARAGWTGLFIAPGFRFRVIDGLLTNFHLPRSSLLLLVAAFAGRERVLAAYAHAVARGYRFYSYGDAMLIL